MADYEMRNQALRGWRCNRATGEGVDRVVERLRTSVPPTDSLFVIPDATVVYALAGRESYRGVPVLWELGDHFKGWLGGRIRKRFLDHPPDWIVLHDDAPKDTLSPGAILGGLGLDRAIAEHYRSSWSYGRFFLLRRERPTSGPRPPESPEAPQPSPPAN